MEIKFLGTGGAVDFKKGNSSALVSIGGVTILIDCGFSTILSLNEKKLFKEIDYILITHLHNDHVGGLPTTLLHYTYDLKTPVPPIIYPSPELKSELEQLLKLSFVTDAEFVPISDFNDNIGFIDTTDQHVPGMVSNSYYFTETDKLIYFSGDIANADTAKMFLDNRTESKITVFHEVAPKKKSSVHTPYPEVQEKLADYDTYVYHVAKENLPADSNVKLVENYPEFLA